MSFRGVKPLSAPWDRYRIIRRNSASSAGPSVSLDIKAFPLTRILKFGLKFAVTVGSLAYVSSIIEWEAIWQAWTLFPLAPLTGVVALLVVNLVVTSLRFGAVLHAFRFPVPQKDLFRTHIYSQIAGIVFFQIVGQTISRAALLKSWKVDAASSVVVSLTERAMVMAVSIAFCILGAAAILPKMTSVSDADNTYAIKFLLMLTTAFVACAFVAFPALSSRFIRQVFHLVDAKKMGQAVLATAGAQIAVALAYVVIASTVAPGISLGDLFAAALVVMFAASIPVSVAGWGIREISAVLVFRELGVPEDAATMIAVSIGALSLLLVVIPLPYFLLSKKRLPGGQTDSATQNQGHDRPGHSLRSVVFYGLPLLCSIAIFFQLKINLRGSEVVVNLADPLAIVAGLMCIWQLIKQRTLPAWTSPYINLSLTAFTAVLCLSLLHGISTFGITGWAINNRFVGWFVLMSYFLAGSLVFGLDPSRRLFDASCRALAVVAATISSVEIALLVLKSTGTIEMSNDVIGYNIEGFALNRNAFAFQLLIVASVCIALPTTFPRDRMFGALLSVIVAAAILTGSRAGWITILLFVAIVAYQKLLSIRQFAIIAGLTTALVSLPHLMVLIGSASNVPTHMVVERIGSDSERMAANMAGLALWLEQPVFGAGLGAFLQQWTLTHDRPLVIHNVAIWSLTETGLVGLLALLAVFWSICRHAPPGGDRERHGAVILAVACLGMTGMFHDMLYQRLLWFTLGMLAISPGAWSGLVSSAQPVSRKAAE